MAVHVIGYDLRKVGRNYDGLYQAIKQYTYCHALDSMWFIETAEDPSTVRSKLCQQVDSNDQIYVLQLEGHWACCLAEICSGWLSKRFP